MKNLSVMAVLILLQACAHGKKPYEGPPVVTGMTPGGYHVAIIDRGSFSSGTLDRLVVEKWLDLRISEWVALRSAAYGGKGKLETIAKGRYFALYDDYRFETKFSKTGYASGLEFDDGTGRIWLAIWSRKGPLDVEPSTSSWLKRLDPDDGKWYQAILTPDHEIPATAHELDHAIGINRDQ